ncbi:unnamed protein product, partial [Mesorhabditis spiculigera]
MSVSGIDFGNLSTYIGMVRGTGIEIISNEQSRRSTTSAVAYGPQTRLMGAAAHEQVSTNLRNTVLNFKELVGRDFSDPVVQRMMPYVSARVVKLPEEGVRHHDRERTFTIEQVLAAIFTKVRATILKHLPVEPAHVDCVVAVPGYYNQTQRLAADCSAQAARLNPIGLINETTAIALSYGISRNRELPASSEAPRIVAFVDVGHTSAQATIAQFSRGKLKILAYTYDLEVGGLWLDARIRHHLVEQFNAKYLDVYTEYRLLEECERIKKLMSATSKPIPLKLEGLLDGADSSVTISRQEFENLAAAIFEKFAEMLRRLLKEADVDIADIYGVELLGGCSRIPRIRAICGDVFGQPPKSTMNPEESVAMGATLRCAMLSPLQKVREFEIRERQLYKISIVYEGHGGIHLDSVIFNEGDEIPSTREMSFRRGDEFTVHAFSHSAATKGPQKIGDWDIKMPSNEQQKDYQVYGTPLHLYETKVTFEIDADGMFQVQKAEMMAPAVEVPSSSLTNTPLMNGILRPVQSAEVDEQAGPSTSTKPAFLPIHLSVQNDSLAFPINAYGQIEANLLAFDEKHRENQDARNAVEEYVYEMRAKLNRSLGSYISSEEVTSLLQELNEAGKWLAEVGETGETSAFKQRLADLKKIMSPALAKKEEKQAITPPPPLDEDS